MDTGIDAPVGRGEHGPGGTAAPRRGRCGLGQRDTREGPLRDRVERRVVCREIGTERLVEAFWRERELLAAPGQLVLHDVRDDPGRGEPRLELGQVLALV